jgi:hypothetical protein
VPDNCAAQELHIAHGSHDCPAEVAHGACCTMSCDDGHELTPVELSSGEPNTGELSCILGTLRRSGSSCDGGACDTSGYLVPNDHGEHDCGDTVDSDNACTLTCENGYYVEGTDPTVDPAITSVTMSCAATVIDVKQ